MHTASQDGYAYSFYDDDHGLEWWHDESTYWPLLHEEENFGPDPTSRPSWSRCTIDWNTCFDPEIKSASGIFKKIAFEEVECGNCSMCSPLDPVSETLPTIFNSPEGPRSRQR
jgi:hypothetical protein